MPQAYAEPTMNRRLAAFAAVVSTLATSAGAYELPLPADPAALGDCAALPALTAEIAADGETDGRRFDELTRLLAEGPRAPLDLAALVGANPSGRAPRRSEARLAPPSWAEEDARPLIWRRCPNDAAKLAAAVRERLQIGAALDERRAAFFAQSRGVREAFARALEHLAAPALTSSAATAPAAATTVARLRELWAAYPRYAALGTDGTADSRPLTTAWRHAVDLERTEPIPPALADLVAATRLDLAQWREARLTISDPPRDDRLADAAREAWTARREIAGTLGAAVGRLADAGSGRTRIGAVAREAGLAAAIVALLLIAWRIVRGSRAWIGRRLLAEFRRGRFLGNTGWRLRFWRGLRRWEGAIPYAVGLALIPTIGALLGWSALPELAALVPWAYAVLLARAARDLGDRLIGATDARRPRMRRSVGAVSTALLGGWLLSDALARLTGEGILQGALHALWATSVALVLLVVLDRWRQEIVEAVDDLGDGALVGRAVATLRGPGGRALTPLAALVWLVAATIEAARGLLASLGRTRTLGDLLFRWRARQIALTRESAGRPRLPDEARAWFGPQPPEGADAGPWKLPQFNLEQIHGHVAAWLDDTARLPLALIGPSGIGHSAALAAIADGLRERPDLQVISLDLRNRVLDETTLVHRLRDSLEAAAAETAEDLAAALDAREGRRVILLDNADRLFLRRLGGFAAYRALLRLAAAGGEKTLWVVAHHDWSWHFLTRAVDEAAWVFEEVELKGWRAEDLATMIDARLAGTGLKVDWSNLAVLDEEEEPDDRRLHDRFYRVLREQSRGVPGAALALALDAFGLAEDGTVAVHLAEMPDAARIVDQSPDVRFVLAALAIHGDLAADDLPEATRLAPGIIAPLISRLIDGGAVERREGRLTIAVHWASAIGEALRRRGYLHGG